ncbi:MAG: hypothetical protein JWM10_1736 [Myxococcaceae bacterium]|nr:hypothetical protein [Myxococcaceae bacterium]
MDILEVMKLAHDRATNQLRELHTIAGPDDDEDDDEVAITVYETHPLDEVKDDRAS